jgi:hypothetical protein
MQTGSEPKVFLESAMPNIVFMVRQADSLPIRSVKLCTDWHYGSKRGNVGMVNDCLGHTETYGAIHPFKISKGLQIWSDMFDAVNF